MNVQQATLEAVRNLMVGAAVITGATWAAATLLPPPALSAPPTPSATACPPCNCACPALDLPVEVPTLLRRADPVHDTPVRVVQTRQGPCVPVEAMIEQTRHVDAHAEAAIKALEAASAALAPESFTEAATK